MRKGKENSRTSWGAPERRGRAGTTTVGHPVDVASGRLLGTWFDVTVSGRMDLEWDRRYSTTLLNQPASPLGLGWSNAFFARLQVDLDGYRFVGPGGDEESFWDPDGEVERGGVVRSLGSFLEIRRQGGEYLVTDWNPDAPPVLRFIFQPTNDGGLWRPRSIERLDGQGVDLAYDQDARLQVIRQRRQGRGLLLTYGPRGLVESVSLLAGPSARPMFRYEHDAVGRLTAATDAVGNSDRYEYDAEHRMVRESRRDGRVYRFEFDARGRCVLTTALDGCDEKRLRYSDLERATEVTDSLENTWRYEWNERGQIEREISPLKVVTATQYDEHGRIVAVVNAVGGETKYAYDENGNRAAITTPDGAESNSEYNAERLLVRRTTPLGSAWEFTYDSENRPATITSPRGVRWSHTWNSAGDLVRIERTPGGAWTYYYDEQGQPRQITDWAGATATLDYDEIGSLVRYVDPLGAEFRYQDNAAGQLVRADFPDGSTILNAYDAAGNVTRTVSPGGAVTTYRYGLCGQLLELENPDGGKVRYAWSSEPNRLEAILDENGNQYTFDYNADGFLIKETYPNGRTVSYARDGAGGVAARTNGAGETTRYQRDPMGQIVAATFFDGSEVRFAYDPAGNVVSAENAEGAVRIERDETGLRTKETFGRYSIGSRYDALGNRVARTSSLGAETAYAYDPRGNLAELRVPPEWVRFERDAEGREARRRYSTGMMLEQAHDGLGRLTEQRLAFRPPPGSTRIESAVLHRRFGYSSDGWLLEEDDRRSGRSTFGYDAVGRLTARLAPGGYQESFTYDAAGNITSASRSFTLVPGGQPASDARSERREIGPANQTLRAGDTVLEYDGDGRVIRKTRRSPGGSAETFQYKWNGLGLLAEVITPSGARWRYHYDAFGRRIRKQGPEQDVVYVWDGNAVLHELPANDGAPTTWTFWPHTFTPLVKQQGGAAYFAVTDHLGTPRELVDETGRIAWAARLTAWGQTEAVGATETDCPIRFQGQWLDPESGLHYNNFRYYDPELGVFLSMDPIPFAAGTNVYQYVPSPTNWIDPFGLAPTYYPLDSLGRPTGAEVSLGRADLRPTDTSPPTVDPPGWKGGQHPNHQQRSHLIGDTLGGSGDDARNIVALTDGSNHPGMSTLEGRIRRHVRKGNRVHVTVTVRYSGNHRAPHSVHIQAVDGRGRVVVDEVVKNGQRQNTGCC